ncbi:MAG: hypothetical protein JW955_05045 [Sedimentisphaerales bacterium]|nr:hypothetical protein [Sedimentisphaerales bacterium]
MGPVLREGGRERGVLHALRATEEARGWRYRMRLPVLEMGEVETEDCGRGHGVAMAHEPVPLVLEFIALSQPA